MRRIKNKKHETQTVWVVMIFLVFMKACYPFDSHIIRFCCSGSKNDVLWIGTNQVGNVLKRSMRTEGVGSKRIKANLPRILHSLLRFPAICVCPTMRISILIRQVGEHGIQNARVYWGSSLEIVRKLQLFKDDIVSFTCMSR